MSAVETETETVETETVETETVHYIRVSSGVAVMATQGFPLVYFSNFESGENFKIGDTVFIAEYLDDNKGLKTIKWQGTVSAVRPALHSKRGVVYTISEVSEVWNLANTQNSSPDVTPLHTIQILAENTVHRLRVNRGWLYVMARSGRLAFIPD